jgi:hypothetical protein
MFQELGLQMLCSQQLTAFSKQNSMLRLIHPSATGVMPLRVWLHKIPVISQLGLL